MLSGLMVLHFYYWGAEPIHRSNGRLAAKTDKEARVGIITAGFPVKLLITVHLDRYWGIAALYYVFAEENAGSIRWMATRSFPAWYSCAKWSAPAGIAGLVGLVAAGVFGAILSSMSTPC